MKSVRRTKTAIAIVISIPFIVPFLFLISTAIREPVDYMADPGGLPKSFTLANIVSAWVDADLGRALLSTLVTCVVACLVSAVAALAGAFWFRLNHGRSIDLLRWILVSGYAIPVVAWLIPVFVILANVGLTANLVIVGLINAVSALPFGLYLVHTYFQQVLTPELLEAATLDGAGVYRIFRAIAFPLSLPALASTIALVFVWTFGDLLIAATLLQGDPSVYTITLAATSLTTREDINLQGQAAAALVALLPTLVVFAVAQKALATGFGGVSDK